MCKSVNDPSGDVEGGPGPIPIAGGEITSVNDVTGYGKPEEHGLMVAKYYGPVYHICVQLG